MAITAPADGEEALDAGRPSRRRSWLLAGLAAAVVVVGVVVQVARPLAADLGPPPSPEGVFDPAFLELATRYRQPLYAAMLAALLIRLGIAALVALTDRGRTAVGRIVRGVGEQRPARAATAVVLTVVVVTDLVLLPLAFWAGFVHDGAFGLRTQGLGGWFYDWFVLHAPVWLGVAVLTLAGYAIARRWPVDWPAIAGLGVGIATVVVAFASPLLLEPLIFRFVVLPEGPVRAEVEGVLDAADARVDQILVADASRRSVRQNAYVSGLGGSRRVVLYDNLVAQRPADEVGVILAHELAHDRHADLLRSNLLAAAGGVVTAYVLWAVLRRRTRTGRQRSAADPRGAAVVLLVVVALNLASTPVQSFVSRRAEAAADLASLRFTDAPEVFERMQRGLAESNLSDPLPPRPVALWWGSHPSTMARIAMARWWAQR